MNIEIILISRYLVKFGLNFLNLVINVKFFIEFEQNIVNINLLEHLVRQNIISTIVEASSHFKTKAFFSVFQLPKWSIVQFGLLKSLEVSQYIIYVFKKISIKFQYSFVQ